MNTDDYMHNDTNYGPPSDAIVIDSISEGLFIAVKMIPKMFIAS